MCAHMCIEMSTCMCGVGKNQLRVRQGDVNQRKEKKSVVLVNCRLQYQWKCGKSCSDEPSILMSISTQTLYIVFFLPRIDEQPRIISDYNCLAAEVVRCRPHVYKNCLSLEDSSHLLLEDLIAEFN